jgi:hypothetical protein
VAWKPEYLDPSEYLRAALDEMERTRPHYESMQASFGGSSLSSGDAQLLRPSA